MRTCAEHRPIRMSMEDTNMANPAAVDLRGKHIVLHGMFIIEETVNWTRYISAEDLTSILKSKGAFMQTNPNSKTTHVLLGLLDREDRRTMVWQDSKRRTLYLKQCDARRGLPGAGPPQLIHDYLAFIENSGIKGLVDATTNMARFRPDTANPKKVPPPPGSQRSRGRIMSATLISTGGGGEANAVLKGLRSC